MLEEEEEQMKPWHWETNLDEVIAWIKWASRKNDFSWTWTKSKNWACKYVDLRIDMRDGAFVICNRDGERISFEELKYQYQKKESEDGS